MSLASIDVSFISLRLVLAPIASTFEADGGDIVPLVKPQFEAGRAEVRDGVVRDPAIHTRVLHDVAGAALAAGLEPLDAIASPILGPEGNREFLLHLRVPRRTARATRIATARSTRHHSRLDLVGQGSLRERGRPAVGFAFNPTSDPAVELKDRAMAWASLHGVDHWAAPAADREGLHRELADTDLLVVLGGDGTFLRAARAVVRDDVPLLGINVGKVGFLSKVEAADAREGARAPRSPAASRSSRGWPWRAASCAMAIRCAGDRLVALNDIVVARGALARVVRLDTSIDESHLASFVADGLVVASPTGSTGYSFSAGGPILGPTARNLVVTPIAGYLTTIRSVVVGPEAVVRARIVDAHEALVSVDGREDIRVEVGDVVEVRAIERPVRLVEPEGSLPFWDLVRRKVELLPS